MSKLTCSGTLACLLLGIGGCDTHQYGGPAADFAAATNLVVEQSKSAFQLVNDKPGDRAKLNAKSVRPGAQARSYRAQQVRTSGPALGPTTARPG
jgi:hypothetical protein